MDARAEGGERDVASLKPVAPASGAGLDGPTEAAVGRAWACIDEARLEELAVAVTSIASPTGGERVLAGYLAGQLACAGLDARVMPIDDGQANAVGRLRGDGSGADLLLYAPIDTLTDGTPEADLPWIGPELRADMVADARVDGPFVSGLGASNPKGHAACVVAAVEAVAAAGLELRGDLIAGFGAGGMPTNARAGQARRNTGHGVGCSYLLEQGVWPDFAIIAKPGWTVSWEEVGLAWFEVRVVGTHTYVGSRHRLAFSDTIVHTATVIDALDRWFGEYTSRHTDGTVAPQGVVAAIEGGWWRSAAITPAVCRFLADVRLSPRSGPAAVRREFAAFVSDLADRHPEIRLEWDLVLAIPGTSTPLDSFVVAAAGEAWEAVAGRPHEVIVANSGATDANILRSRGIPTVRVGMPKVTDLGVEVDFQRGMNTVDVREMVRLTRLLVRAALNVCGRPVAETGADR